MQLDYHFSTQHSDSAVAKPYLNSKALIAIDLHTGIATSVTVSKKRLDKFVISELCKFLIEAGHANATLRSHN